jgi:hypothetical protein
LEQERMSKLCLRIVDALTNFTLHSNQDKTPIKYAP